METRPQNVSGDRSLTITQSNKRSKTSINGGGNSEPIPIDLIIEILLRLPAKSIAKCRCVSKLWASVLRRPDFTELFLTRSWARPQLLFICQNNGELFFFSSPQPHNPDQNSPPITANYHMKIQLNFPTEKFSPINGLVFVRDERVLKGRENTMLLSAICNPSTGQSLTLPKVKTKRMVGIRSFFGYDPIEKQFKVLSMALMLNRTNDVVAKKHHVLTLGTRQLSWKRIECCIPHFPGYSEICINGVLYYPAVNRSSRGSMIVCFDVRSEKFRFITVVEAFIRAVRDGTMINYNGKLGSLVSERSCCVSGRSRSIELWVLEDAEKQEWSKHTYVLPALWQNIVGTTYLRFVGVTRTNDIVLSPYHQFMSFYIFYYNIERNTITRVEIQGMEAFNNKGVYTFLDHVEDVKLLQVF